MRWRRVIAPSGLILAILLAIATCQSRYYANMEHIPKGSFEMGCADCQANERPIHIVALDAFWMDQHETTFARYAEFLNAKLVAGEVEVIDKSSDGSTWREIHGSANRLAYVSPMQGSQFVFSEGRFTVGAGNEQLPATVTWHGATAFCRSLGKRLPTEAEWEYAAKDARQADGVPDGADYLRYAGSNDAEPVAWHRANAGGTAHAVGGKHANQLGFFDLSGNAREWVNDWYGAYAGGIATNPPGPTAGDGRVMRGGSWSEDTYPDYVDESVEMAVDPVRVRVTKRDKG